VLAVGCQSDAPQTEVQEDTAATTMAPAPTTTAVAETAQQIVLKAQDVRYSPGPPVLPPGTEVAVLQGDPTKPGPFVQRARFPDGARVQPHTHPATDNITVLEGTFYLGFGDRFSEETAEALPAGSYFSIPANTPHFAYVQGRTLVELHGTGPFTLNYVR
jgi:quercetin dioxygenase-like cupin family protein